MPADPMIKVEALGKRYTIRHVPRNDTLRDTLANGARAVASRLVRGTPRPSSEEFWALRDVSFEVARGEVLGIIGRNGAGKSTLLKLLSRIAEPTSGSVYLNGTVASLLEVGTGFHPELSGRENIFLNGVMLGMSRAEIQCKFDEIVSFAEVERFLDTPVKRYSSGMYVRLAFAVAAHVAPEILIVDEVLAVGDAQFQKKCLGKMGEVARTGRTVLLVTHNLGIVSNLASRCMVLDEGRLTKLGTPAEAVQHYLESGHGSGKEYTSEATSQDPLLRRITVITSGESGIHESGRTLKVRFEIDMPESLSGTCLSFQIVNQYQHPAVHAWIYDPDRPFCRRLGSNVWQCDLPDLNLNVGTYSLRAFLSQPPGGRQYDLVENVCEFEVVHTGRPPLFGYRPDACVYLAGFDWKPSQ